METILNARLADVSKEVDTSTPADGHCLFHGLKSQGFVDENVTIAQMRAGAMRVASAESVAVAAADAGKTVAAYRAGMLRGDYADELILGSLAMKYGRSITVQAPTNRRSFTPTGDENGAVEGSWWVAFNDINHYYGTRPKVQMPEPVAGVAPAKARSKQPPPAKVAKKEILARMVKA